VETTDTQLLTSYTVKGELNPETNVGLNEYLLEIKFCTGQESVDVVQRKKIFNDKNHYLFTYFKNCVSGRTEVVIDRPYYTCTFIYATSAFTKTLLSERRGTNV